MASRMEKRGSALPALPGISSQMNRDDLVESIMARLKVHGEGKPFDPAGAYVYGVSVIEPRPYFLADKMLVAKLGSSLAVQGYLHYNELYAWPFEQTRAVLKEFVLTAKQLQVKFRDVSTAGPNAVNVTLV